LGGKNGDSTWVRGGMNMIPCHNNLSYNWSKPSSATTILPSHKLIYQLKATTFAC